MKNKAVTLLAILSLFGACSDDTNPAQKDGAVGPKDGLGTKEKGPGTDGTPASGLKVSAALGLDLTLDPFPSEGKGLKGYIRIESGGKDVNDATVKVNGVEVPKDSFMADWYQPSSVAIPDLGPGKTITITASRGTETGSLSFTCPTAMTITAPSEGTAFAEGEAVTLSWTGKLDYAHIGFGSSAYLGQYDAATKAGKLPNPTQKDQYKSLKDTDTSASFKAPTLESPYTGFFGQLSVLGETTLVKGTALGYCILVTRVHLTKK